MAVAVSDGRYDDAEGLWHTRPASIHSQEEAFARKYDPGYATHRVDTTLTDLGSGLLRRHLLFRTPDVTSIDLWLDSGRIEVEWFDGPNHGTVIPDLTDAAFGIPAVPTKNCRCGAPEGCYSIPLVISESAIALRRNTDGWSAQRDVWSARARTRRLSRVCLRFAPGDTNGSDMSRGLTPGAASRQEQHHDTDAYSDDYDQRT